MTEPKPKCKHPHTRRRRSYTYDAYYCMICGTWLERRCGDPKCEFCKNRPRRVPVKDRATNGS